MLFSVKVNLDVIACYYDDGTVFEGDHLFRWRYNPATQKVEYDDNSDGRWETDFSVVQKAYGTYLTRLVMEE
jgi:hypothetical protein